MKFYRVLLLFVVIFVPRAAVCEEPSPINLAIVGFGGRAQGLLLWCLEQNPHIRVVAVSDDRAEACIQYQRDSLAGTNSPLLSAFQNAVAETSLYPNTPEGLTRLFQENPALDTLFLTSANYDHLWQLKNVLAHCSDKKIFMEKPIFRALEEYTSFDFAQAKDKTVIIGLTLRYSSMAAIVAKELQEHQHALGALSKVKVWERLNFTHALTAFIMGWRRYIDLSGGLLLEKSIHDVDLALFFIDALGIDPSLISVSTETANRFFIKSRKAELLDFMLKNEAFRKRAAHHQYRSWEPANFVRNEQGEVDWQASLDAIFAEYPDGDDFSGLNLIPDYHKFEAALKSPDGALVNVEVEVDMAGYRPKTERGQHFVFEHGEVLVDIMASNMRVTYNDGAIYEYDLKTNGSDHADGDEHIIQTILGYPTAEGYHMATLNDPLVKLANLISLVSEHQAVHGPSVIALEKDDQAWKVVNSLKHKED